MDSSCLVDTSFIVHCSLWSGASDATFSVFRLLEPGLRPPLHSIAGTCSEVKKATDPMSFSDYWGPLNSRCHKVRLHYTAWCCNLSAGERLRLEVNVLLSHLRQLQTLPRQLKKVWNNSSFTTFCPEYTDAIQIRATV